MHSKSVSLTAEDGFKLILSHGLQEHEYTLCTNRQTCFSGPRDSKNVLAIKCMQIHLHSVMPTRQHGFVIT